MNLDRPHLTSEHITDLLTTSHCLTSLNWTPPAHRAILGLRRYTNNVLLSLPLSLLFHFVPKLVNLPVVESKVKNKSVEWLYVPFVGGVQKPSKRPLPVGLR